jgi:cysteine synthase A
LSVGDLAYGAFDAELYALLIHAMKLSELTLPPWFFTPAARHIAYGIFIGFTLSVTSTSISSYWRLRRRQRIPQEGQFEFQPIELRSNEVLNGVTGLIGA